MLESGKEKLRKDRTEDKDEERWAMCEISDFLIRVIQEN